MDRRCGGTSHLAINVGIDIWDVVSRDHVLEPHQMERLECVGEADRVRNREPRPDIERQTDIGAKNFLHRLDTSEDVPETAFGQESAVKRTVERTWRRR